MMYSKVIPLLMRPDCATNDNMNKKGVQRLKFMELHPSMC